MKIIKTKFDGLNIIKKLNFNDIRGSLTEVFIKNKFKSDYCYDYFSTSKKNVIRGLHMQIKDQQEKYITVLNGKIFDVCLDLRKNSKTFGKIFSTTLSKKNNLSLIIPIGFAHGFCALENNTIVYYKNSKIFLKNYQVGIKWNDPILKIKWPIKNPIISNKDCHNQSYNDFLNRYIRTK